MNAMLQWELDWVMDNADRYGCLWHAKAVCGNITKRYHIAKTKRLAADFNRDSTHENFEALMEHINES